MHEFYRAAKAEERIGAEVGGQSFKPGWYNDKMLSPEDAAALEREHGTGSGGHGGNGRGIIPKPPSPLKPYRIWGMTSRILIDAARIAYGREPEFECLEEKGDEEMISLLWHYGVLKDERRHGEDYAVVELYNMLEGWTREKGNL